MKMQMWRMINVRHRRTCRAPGSDSHCMMISWPACAHAIRVCEAIFLLLHCVLWRLQSLCFCRLLLAVIMHIQQAAHLLQA